MDKMLELKNIESMKKTIQMHEQVFKHQVQELHRLYNLQKKLMHELQNGKETIALMNNTNSRIDPSSSCSGDESSRMAIKFELEKHKVEKELQRKDEETDVEVDLTLSIGHCTKKKTSKNYLDHCSRELHDFDKSNNVYYK
ncbi:hypothetical protein ACJIZ3_005465 [Penstemon smallii]|uniref:Uncharacterized protein n=1 Tax=Penstemon smallii TaxID=265156 RepID=A0ABD3S4Y8_9LAMI